MNRRNLKMRVLSFLVASTMLSSIVLPQNIAFAETGSSSGFSAAEVNRILASLTPEQKSYINKLTGSDNAQKIHIDPTELRSADKIDVIVRFNVEPAKIQMVQKALAQVGANVNNQVFAADYSEAQKKVEDSHKEFKTFINTQVKTELVGGKDVKSSMTILREYTEAFNGVALSVLPSELNSLAENSLVHSIWPVERYEASPGVAPEAAAEGTSTGIGKPTTSLTLLGIDKLQAAGNTGIFKSGPNAGKKVKVGVIDTGVDYNHPDLYKATHDANGNRYGGHDFVNSVVNPDGTVTFIDDNDPMETIYPDWVDAKENPTNTLIPATQDYKKYVTSHGTHVSGTIAANTTDNNAVYSANGVAPDVELHGYRVLGPGGSGMTDAILKGIDQSVKDDMDVINLSLGSATNDPLYPTSIAVNNATIAGVTCMVAAANAGPNPFTVGSPGSADLAITVGASTIPTEIPVMTIKHGTTDYQARLFGKSFADSNDAFKGQNIPIVDVGLGTVADYNGKDLIGKIALVKRGGDTLNTKMANAKKSGAKGMIIWNNTADESNQGYNPNSLGVGMDNIYSLSLTQAQGQALVDAIAKDPSNATITYPSTLDTPILKQADQLANFSSAGPTKNYDIKPDVVSPGVDIISTVPYDIWEHQDGKEHDYKYSYQSMNGTSMATPHAAGIAALILAVHPDYTPADVKAALMNTAKDIDTASTTYSVYQVGAGRVDPARAINTDVKIQVLDKATSYDDPYDAYKGIPEFKQIDDLTGSIFFGYKGRGEGATNGSDDVVSSKDFNVTNRGTSNKTFNVSTEFISTKWASSNPVGAGTGNNVKVDISVNDSNTTSITVGGTNTVKATAKITVPSNAIEGTYEGYINLVNASDSTESYRIPFTITVAEKGVNFKVVIKAFTLSERYTGNVNVNAGGPGSLYNYSITSKMKDMYLLVKNKQGDYIGVAQNISNISYVATGVTYTNKPLLTNGLYLPFTKIFDGTLDQSGIAKTPEALKEGAYSVEMIATDDAGKLYRAEDTVYVDYQAPTMTMDSDSKQGIYEIDTTGAIPGQEVQSFYGTVYDSNIDVMKNNGETSIVDFDTMKPVPVDQGMNKIYAYQDSIFVTTILNTDANGRFHFGLAPEDITPQGSEVRIYAADYSGAGDINTQQKFYFIKKGSPYITLTSLSDVNADGRVVVDTNKPFKATIATKNAIGMTGGKFSINNNKVYDFSNIRLSEEYKNYLSSKGIDPNTVVLTVSDPYLETEAQFITGNTTDITISGIPAAGALDKDMNILEADVKYNFADPIVGPWDFKVVRASLTLSGNDTKVPAFMTNWPYLQQPTSMMTGPLFAEGFRVNNLSGSFNNITVESGAKVTVTDDKGKSFTTNNPTTSNNTIEYLGNKTGIYSVSMDVSDKPYKVETSMPGHFKDYITTPVIGSSRWGYQSGTYYNRPSYDAPLLLGGDVNSDNVIDMKDLIDEVGAYYSYKALTTTTAKKAFLNDPNNRKYDIRWVSTTAMGGYGIDYFDFYFIFKNFGLQNQLALKAGLTVDAPQLTLTADTMVNGVQLHAGDGVDKVKAALNFAGAAQKLTSTTIPKLEDLQNGSKITLIPNDSVFVDDLVWRNAITEIDLNGVDVTNTLIPNTTDKAVTRAAGYYYWDSLAGSTLVPSKITLDGSLFTAAGNYTVAIKATGYQDVTVTFTVAATPIPVPEIPLVIDPTKAHLGNDLTYTFTENANWRNGINKIVVKTKDWALGVDITNMTDGSGNKYYDISQSGQITFKKELFKTNGTTTASPIEPGGANYLPQQYKFEISSIGTDGTIYPLVTAGTYKGDTALNASQAIGYGITFDTQGGANPNPIAVGFLPSRQKYGTNSSDWALSQTSPTPVRPGYVFQGWWNESACTTAFNPGAYLTADKTLYAKWKMNVTQNYSLVDKNNPNGAKFDGVLWNGDSASGKGWVLGEGNIEINIPDYLTNVSWLTGKDSIASIQATYYKIKTDGTADTVTTTYTLDPSTYEFKANGDNSATLSFTTETEAKAAAAVAANPNAKFAFSAAPAIKAGYVGYNLTVTSTGGQTTTIHDVKLGYRRHIDLNGGTYKIASPRFWDTLVNGKATVPDMTNALDFVTNGNLSVSKTMYLDSAGTSGNTSPVSNNNGVYINDNVNYYLCWIKTPPTVLKDTVENIVGTDITLTFADDATWRNNIKKVMIGSKELALNSDYTLTNGAMTLDRSLFTAAQKFNVVIVSEGYADVVVTDQIIGHKVTFESNGGEAVPTQIVDSRVTIPDEPAYAGYKFAGWYTDEALTTPFNFASVVTKPMTLYAKYALVGSIVTVDTINNALGNDVALDFNDVEWAKVITGINLNGSPVDVTKYKIDTTNRTITFDKSVFTKVGDFNITISATDYANVTVSQKIVNGINVHLVLPSDAPTVVKDTVKDQIVTRRITEPTVYGYDLTWFTDEACTIPWDFTSSIYSSKTLYAKWSLHEFDVMFNTQDGGLVESKKAVFNTTITEPTAPTRTGYTFGGWYKDAECTTAWNFETDTVTADTILYAKWTINSYTVNFDSQGGTSVDKVVTNYNTLITAPTAPTRAGYTFAGWYKDAECTTEWNFATDLVTVDTTLYAKWTINSYTINFDSQGGSSVDSIKADYNTIPTAPTAPTREGYTFGGWYKDAACTTEWNFATDTVTADTTLYAKWTINTYTLSFDSQGGSSVDSIKADYNTIPTAPTAPTRKGYTFGGWYKDAECTTPWNFETDKVTADTKVFAKWTANTVTPPSKDDNASGNNDGKLPQAGALVGVSKYIELGSLMMFMGLLLVVSRRLKKNNKLK